MTERIYTSDVVVTKSMKLALGVSAILHLSFLIIGMVGLPYIKKPPLLPPKPIAVEILEISEETTANKPPVESRVKPKEETPPEPLKAPPKVAAPPKVDTKAPPKIKPIEQPPKVKETKKPEPKVPPPPKEKLEKPKPPEPKKEEPKKEEAAAVEDDLFQSVLKNLQEAPDAATPVTPEKKAEVKPAEKSPLARFSERLSASEVDAIVRALDRQFSSCWNLMAGARNAENITVTLKLTVNQDRTVRTARIADQWRYNNDTFYRAAADSALRAVRHPNCEVLDLPADKYELWKELTFNFNPASQL